MIWLWIGSRCMEYCGPERGHVLDVDVGHMRFYYTCGSDENDPDIESWKEMRVFHPIPNGWRHGL